VATEIERKFLLRTDAWRRQVSHSQRMRQGYLSASEKGSARVRIAGDDAWLNIKSATIGIERLEYEYLIPLSDAEEMLDQLCGKQVDKTRHYVPADDLLWEIDEFHAESDGLVVAEIELPSTDAAWPQPEWLGAEVSGDKRYYNNELARHPYKEWSASGND